MTPDERDRLKALEVEVRNFKDTMSQVAADVAEIKKALHMGQGAGVLLLKIGAFMAAIAVAVSWVWDHVAHLVGK